MIKASQTQAVVNYILLSQKFHKIYQPLKLLPQTSVHKQKEVLVTELMTR